MIAAYVWGSSGTTKLPQCAVTGFAQSASWTTGGLKDRRPSSAPNAADTSHSLLPLTSLVCSLLSWRTFGGSTILSRQIELS